MIDYVFYLRAFVHYFLHFVFPFFIAKIFFKNKWKRAYLLMLATMIIDLDHVFADPLFDPHRNSIGYHPLHSYPAIAIYFAAALFGRGDLRIIGIGLVLHILTDLQDFWLW